MSYPIISADSHLTESPNYTDYVARAWRERMRCGHAAGLFRIDLAELVR